MTTSFELPDVSVVIPCYRQAGFVGACLDSVARQTYRGRVEVIVVDDGCPQGSGDVAAAHSLRPRVVRQPNSGVAEARNRGIAASSGPLIAFLDADDVWHPEKLDRQVERMRGSGAPALCFTRYHRLLAGTGESLGATPAPSLEPDFALLARVNFIGCSTVLVHRECLDYAGGFPDSRELRKGGQDYALWLRIATRYPLVYVPEVLVDYLVHGESRVGLDPVKNFEGAVSALRAFRNWSRAGAENAPELALRTQIVRHFSDVWATLHAGSADFSTRWRALRSLFRALRA